MNGIEILIHAIKCSILLGASTFSDVDSDEVLSGRDESRFDRRWVQLKEQIKSFHLTDVEAANLEQLRELAFKTTFKHCSDPELSGEISDDFGLIGLGVASRCEDSFLAELLESYLAGKIPSDGLSASKRSLQSLVEVLHQAQ